MKRLSPLAQAILIATLLIASVQARAFPHVEMPDPALNLRHNAIYSGKLPSKNSAIWKSVIRVQTDSASCTGMIIGTQSILTAAHCLQEDTKTITIELFRGPRVALTHKFYEDEFLITSRNYKKGSPNEADNDLSVITVNRRITDDEHEVISLFTSDDLPLLEVGRSAYLIGAGSKGGNVYSDELRFTEGHFKKYSSSSVRVLAETGTGICGGDSGGALAVLVENKFHLVGVLSGFIMDDSYPDPEKTCGGSALYSFLNAQKSDWIDATITEHLDKLK